jgi:hypothetical protein
MHRIASLSLVVLTGSSVFSEPTNTQLQDEIQQLREQLHQFKSTSAQTADVDRVVKDVLTDARQRSQLFAVEGGLTAGYDKGFFIKSEDGRFLLRPQLQWQFRYVTSYRSDDNDDIQDGFENRRTRFRFDGNAFSPDLTYSFVFDTSRSTGSVSLLDAWAQYKFAGQWAMRIGQFKEQVFQERNISGYSQLAVERSLADAILGGANTDRVQGVALVYGAKDQPLKAEFALHDGANSKNTDFRNPSANPTDWGVGGRVEYKFSGDWSAYKDFTAKGTKQDLFVLGAGADITERENSITYLTTLDAQYENPNGLSVYGALHGNFGDLRNAIGDDSRFDWGFLAQAGYAFNGNWEVFGRVSYLQLDDDFVDNDSFSEFTIGANYYLGSNGEYLHRAKITIDVSYLPDGIPSDQTALGALANDGDEIVLRGQFQLQI